MSEARGWFAWNRDLLAASASGLVGALALATSTYNVYLQRQQVRAQVWPRLNLDDDWSDDVVTLQVQNRGMGPANVKRVRVSVDGAPAGDWVAAILALLKKKSMRLPNINKLEGQVMSPGFQIAPLKISGPDAVEFLKQRQRLAFEACYCSTLDECWVLSVPNLAEESTTIAVEDCKADAKPFESVNAKTLDQILEKLSPDAGTH
ncbi:MAG TPA: hypothetical protein VH083_12680 [Myxococcales bacterium]|nr:hypothetical protein [Myxococcales bacterium]